MSSDLLLRMVDSKAATYAVKRWHYSFSMPAGALFCVGVFEGGEYVGCVIYSRGASPMIGSPYGLTQTGVVELTRVALGAHKTPVSRILAISLRVLKAKCPGLRLVVSYADKGQGHHGGIYQANGWTYTGISKAHKLVIVNGKMVHQKTATALKGSLVGLDYHGGSDKHVYVMPLDSEMRDKVKAMAKGYPKPEKQHGISTPDDVGGATPTLGHK